MQKNNPMLPTEHANVPIAGKFEVPEVPAGVHPRIYLRTEDLDNVNRRRTCKNSDIKGWYNRITTHLSGNPADAVLANSDMNFDDTLFDPIQCRALMYLLDKNSADPMIAAAAQKYGKEAVKMAAEYMRTLDMRGMEDGYQRGNKLTDVFMTVSMAYDWCYDLLFEPFEPYAPDRKSVYPIPENATYSDVIVAGFRFHAFYIEDEFPTGFYRNANTLNGHHLQAQLWAMAAVAIAVYDEDTYFWDEIEDFFFNRYFPTQNYMMEGGINWNGISYGPTRSRDGVQANYIFYMMQEPGRRKSFLTADVVDIFNTGIYFRRADGQYARLGDFYNGYMAHGNKHTHAEVHAILHVNAIFHDPYLQRELTSGIAYHRAPSPVIAFLTWSEVEPKQYEGNLPLSKYLGDPNGEVLAMTGWLDGWNTDFDSNIMHVNMRFGINTNNHDHLDAGSFQIYYKGALAVDGGVYNGKLGEFGGPHDREWDKATISHNSILIRDPNYNEKFGKQDVSTSNPEFNQFLWRGHKLENSGGQLYSFGGGRSVNTPMDVYRDTDGVVKYFPRGNQAGIPIDSPESQWAQSRVISASIEAETLEPSYSYLKGDMTELYGYRAENVTRSFMFYNFKDDDYPGALIVFDKITAGSKYNDYLDYEKYFLLHSLYEPVIEYDENGNITHFIIQNIQAGIFTDEEMVNNIAGKPYAYNGQLVTTPLLPPKGDVKAEIVHGYKVFGKEFDNVSVYDGYGTEEAGKWMLMASPKSKAQTHLMLNVLQCQDAGTKPLDVSIVGSADDKMVGAKINGFVTMFSTSGNLLDGSINIPRAGEGAEILEYYVTDLTAGKWTVCDANNQCVAEFTVKCGENIGHFTLPAMDYVLVGPANNEV